MLSTALGATGQAPMFELLVDLGVIVVPDDYDHATRLAMFKERYYDEFCNYSDAITDENFGNPSRILKAGDRLRVRAFRQVVDSTSPEDRLAFLATRDAVLTGAQGASLVLEQKRDELPRGKWCTSMDEEDHLPFVEGHHRVPDVGVGSDGDPQFQLVEYEYPWHDGGVLLCFEDCA